ncbi:MAG: hypothetical protein U1F07_12980 [Rubrivivax sp.]
MTNTPVSAMHALPRPRGVPSFLAMINCRELFAELAFDPALAGSAVPQSYSIKLLPTGKAKLLFLIEECEKGVLDAVLPVRPLKMAQLWIELDGPEEVAPPLSGTTSSLPTSYWYALPHQMESMVAATAFRVAGIDIQRVARIDIGGAHGAPRQGAVIEDSSGGERYGWEEATRLWDKPNVVTGRRWFFREYGGMLRRRSVGFALCRSAFIGDGEISVTASPNSALGRLGIGSLRGLSNSVVMNCKVQIRVAPL